jgi:restriction system protein
VEQVDTVEAALDTGDDTVEFGTSMTLDAWLAAVRDPKRQKDLLVTYQFPTDRHRSQYLKSIGDRADEDVRFLLRNFLIGSGTLGSDFFTARHLVHQLKSREPFRKTEFTRRLVGAALSKGRVQPWEGVTWVLDLLPESPRKALEVIDAYFDVHAAFMPDGRLAGMSDARSIIRSKYILVGDIDGCEGALDKVTPREFEVLVAALYRSRGYTTRLTPATKDGGRDVIASKNRPGEKERCLVECKHHKKSIGVKDILEPDHHKTYLRRHV